jgi:ATP-dependent Clp protease protease subunit
MAEKNAEDIKAVFNLALSDRFELEDLNENRHIYLNCEVDEDVINNAVYHILRFNRIDKSVPIEERKPIIIFINSPGGQVVEGWALIDAITNSKTPVYTVNLGQCASMAFMIAIAGHKRYAMPHSEYMMHAGYCGAFDDLNKVKDRIDFETGEMEQMTRHFILTHTDMESEFYDKKYRCDFYFLTDTAKSLGVVDYVIGQDCVLDEVI